MWCIYASVKHTNIASDNGLLPVWHQAIIWTNAAIMSIRPQRTYFSEILFEIGKFSFKKMHLKMSSAKWWPFCLGLNVSNVIPYHLSEIDHDCADKFTNNARPSVDVLLTKVSDVVSLLNSLAINDFAGIFSDEILSFEMIENIAQENLSIQKINLFFVVITHCSTKHIQFYSDKLQNCS